MAAALSAAESDPLEEEGIKIHLPPVIGPRDAEPKALPGWLKAEPLLPWQRRVAPDTKSAPCPRLGERVVCIAAGCAAPLGGVGTVVGLGYSSKTVVLLGRPITDERVASMERENLLTPRVWNDRSRERKSSIGKSEEKEEETSKGTGEEETSREVDESEETDVVEDSDSRTESKTKEESSVEKRLVLTASLDDIAKRPRKWAANVVATVVFDGTILGLEDSDVRVSGGQAERREETRVPVSSVRSWEQSGHLSQVTLPTSMLIPVSQVMEETK